jgi:MOSC domain-containing protein YiiM
MRLVSLNVGLPREVVWKGRTVTTGIFKEPVVGSVRLGPLNLEGDRQADLSVHGGPHKAVYAYPSEHYDYWRAKISDLELPWGMFGENFTTSGLWETSTSIGDQLRIGSAVVMVTQPRMPCYKLAVKFGRDDIIQQFLDAGRPGFYFAVLQEGEVKAGDTFEWVHRDPLQVTVADVTRLYLRDKNDSSMLRRALQVEALPDGWRRHFQAQIDKAG